ncbi:MAG: hypothetical protein HWN65_14355 [Candidatus Helarchaeota archaeon]|nr:hypothetical protein [Candidatus Helarchaeota archaeon]
MEAEIVIGILAWILTEIAEEWSVRYGTRPQLDLELAKIILDDCTSLVLIDHRSQCRDQRAKLIIRHFTTSCLEYFKCDSCLIILTDGSYFIIS